MVNHRLYCSRGSNQRRGCQLWVMTGRKGPQQSLLDVPHNTTQDQSKTLLSNPAINYVCICVCCGPQHLYMNRWPLKLLKALAGRWKTLSGIQQQKTNDAVAARHFCWAFNLIYCTKMLLRPKASVPQPWIFKWDVEIVLERLLESYRSMKDSPKSLAETVLGTRLNDLLRYQVVKLKWNLLPAPFAKENESACWHFKPFGEIQYVCWVRPSEFCSASQSFTQPLKSELCEKKKPWDQKLQGKFIQQNIKSVTVP